MEQSPILPPGLSSHIPAFVLFKIIRITIPNKVVKSLNKFEKIFQLFLKLENYFCKNTIFAKIAREQWFAVSDLFWPRFIYQSSQFLHIFPIIAC